MAEWNLYGSERREIFEESIKPESLFYTLQQYQKTFGKTFSIVELLELEKFVQWRLLHKQLMMHLSSCLIK